MDLLARNKSLLFPTRVREVVPIDGTLSREAQFEQWLATVTKHCKIHPHTQLTPRITAESGRPPRNPDADVWYAWHSRYAFEIPQEQDREKFYPFEADFDCIACVVAHSLCPPNFHETSFASFDTSTPERAAVLSKARDFASQVKQHKRGFALFVGAPGTGKTRLACNIVRELEHRTSLYVRQGQLTLALRATYGQKRVVFGREAEEDDEAEPTVLEITQKIRFLVLDEIGCAPLANDERLLLDELLKYRYDHGEPTVLISNLPLSDLKSFLGDALTERIKHASGNGRFIVQFRGESYRRADGENYLGAPFLS